MIEDKKEFICKVREIVYNKQFYDMNEFFVNNYRHIISFGQWPYKTVRSSIVRMRGVRTYMIYSQLYKRYCKNQIAHTISQ